MPFCPRCRQEYESWVKVCPDCGSGLADKLPPGPELETVPSEKLVTIATFSHPEEAHLASAKLESEAIWSFVADEHTVRNYWMCNTALGWVKLRVRESDVVKASEILKIREPPLKDYDGIACPICHSSYIQYETFSLRPMFITWLLSFLMLGNYGGFILPFFKRKKLKCSSCGYRWEPAKTK